MASLVSLASKYDPNSPNYDPSATPPADPVAQAAPPVDPSLAATTAITNANKVMPSTQTFNEATGVEGRVNRMIGADSSLMQTARTQAAQAAQARGIGASSLGVQAGEQAVINTATPIAAADAAATSQQNLANQTALNNASTTNAQLGVTAGVQGLSLAEQARQFGVTNETQKTQFDANLALQNRNLDAQMSQFAQSLGMSEQDLALRKDTLTAQQKQAYEALQLQKDQLVQQGAQFAASQTQQMVLAQADATLKRDLAALDSQWRQDVNSSTNIANAWGTMMTNISAIQNNSALEADAKATLIANTTAGFASFAKFWKTTTDVDVGALLDYNIVNGGGTGITAPTPAPAPAQAAPGAGFFDQAGGA